MIFQLIYVSEAREDLSYQDLENILLSAKRRNKELDLTGVLIYRDGFFIQLLEGKKENVKLVLSSIVRDPRHSKLRVVLEAESAKRFFTNWSMSFVDGDIEKNSEWFMQQVFSDVMLAQLPDQKLFQQFFERIPTSGLELR